MVVSVVVRTRAIIGIPPNHHRDEPGSLPEMTQLKFFATRNLYENVIASVGNHVGEKRKRAPDSRETFLVEGEREGGVREVAGGRVGAVGYRRRGRVG